MSESGIYAVGGTLDKKEFKRNVTGSVAYAPLSTVVNMNGACSCVHVGTELCMLVTENARRS